MATSSSSEQQFWTPREASQGVEVVPSAEVKGRIESLVLEFLRGLKSSKPGILPFVCNRTLVPPESGEGESQVSLADNAAPQAARRLHLYERQGRTTRSYLRGWKILSTVFNLCQSGNRVSQRELYYCLLAEANHLVKRSADVSESIQDVGSLLECTRCKSAPDVVSLLECTRCSLQINAAARGSVAGCLLVQTSAYSSWINCALQGNGGLPITGDLRIIKQMRFLSSAKCILVVEKDACFQRLCDENIFERLPCILITARGFPDLATRVFLSVLSSNFPALPIYGLFDMNPAGMHILCNYKFGSGRMGLESPQYACDVKWLGLRSSDIDLLPVEATQELTDRDLSLAKGLLSSGKLEDFPAYLAELHTMVDNGRRADIEGLCASGHPHALSEYIICKINSSDAL